MSTLNLFDVEKSTNDNEETETRADCLACTKVLGLDYLPLFVSAEVEEKIFAALEEQPWIGDLERRVQHYGYRYNYKSRRIDESMRVGELPKWMQNIGMRLVHRGYFDGVPDQVIVNEYLPGQGITAHIDCEPCFGETIASLSLGSGCYMDFSRPETGEKVSVWLERRSLVLLQRDARHVWRHAIAKRMNDMVDGQTVSRTRRVSLTFRKVKSEWLSK